MSQIMRWVLRAAILWAAERVARKVVDRVVDRPAAKPVQGDYEVTNEQPAPKA